MKIFRLFLALTLVCFALLPTAQAVVPTPDGGYAGLNTAEGKNALLSLDTSTGVANTAVGWFSLTTDVNGSFNTGVGAGTLLLNVGDPTTGDGRMELGPRLSSALQRANHLDCRRTSRQTKAFGCASG
jgi:hypothetical protein